MKKILLSTAIALVSTSASADYQFEVSGAFGQSDTTTTTTTIDQVFLGGTVEFTDKENAESDNYNVGGVFHFSPVDTTKGPLAEAAFLDQSSFVTFNYDQTEPDGNCDEIDTYNIGGRLVTASDVIVELDYANTEFNDEDSDRIRAGIGTYINDRTDIVVSYQTSTDDNDDQDIINIALHGVSELAGTAFLAYDLGLDYIDAENDEGYGVNAGGTYYFNNLFGLGVTASLQEIGDLESDRVAARASLFPFPELRIGASYFDETLELNNLEVESDGFRLEAALRF